MLLEREVSTSSANIVGPPWIPAACSLSPLGFYRLRTRKSCYVYLLAYSKVRVAESGGQARL